MTPALSSWVDGDRPRAGVDARTLVLDFDGTVCIGDAPVLAYAAAVADVASRLLPAELADELRHRLDEELAAYFAGHTARGSYTDGYGVVAAISAGRLDPADLNRAYAASRVGLDDGNFNVTAPDGIIELLRSLAGRVERLVVTNAPDPGVTATLARLGVLEHLDGVITAVGKPAGWTPLLPALLGAAPAHSLMTVGDVWVNDIAPPLNAGSATALIDRFGERPGPAHLSAPTLTELIDGIAAWANDPGAFAAAHPVLLHPSPVAHSTSHHSQETPP